MTHPQVKNVEFITMVPKTSWQLTTALTDQHDHIKAIMQTVADDGIGGQVRSAASNHTGADDRDIAP